MDKKWTVQRQQVLSKVKKLNLLPKELTSELSKYGLEAHILSGEIKSSLKPARTSKPKDGEDIVRLPAGRWLFLRVRPQKIKGGGFYSDARRQVRDEKLAKLQSIPLKELYHLTEERWATSIKKIQIPDEYRLSGKNIHVVTEVKTVARACPELRKALGVITEELKKATGEMLKAGSRGKDEVEEVMKKIEQEAKSIILEEGKPSAKKKEVPKVEAPFYPVTITGEAPPLLDDDDDAIVLEPQSLVDNDDEGETVAVAEDEADETPKPDENATRARLRIPPSEQDKGRPPNKKS